MTNACMQCPVRERAICQSLSAGELDKLSRLGRHQDLKRGQTIVWQDEEANLVGNVVEGVLKLCVSSPDGREQTLGIMFPEDFIGRPFGPRNGHSVVALTDARVCTFRRSGFDEFAREHPDLEHRLLQRTLTDLDRTRQWMLLLGRRHAHERLAAFLLEMCARTASPEELDAGQPIELQLPLGRQDIADLLGLTIETVSRQMTTLRNDGIIETPSRRIVIVNDLEALRDCADDV